jgi:hypothetical protein
MSDFLILVKRIGISDDVAELSFRRACSALRRSRECSPNLLTRHESGFRIARLVDSSSPASPFVQSYQSWLFAHGAVSRSGKMVAGNLFVQLLQDIAIDAVSAARTLDGVYAIVAATPSGHRLFVIPSPLGLFGVYTRKLGEKLIGISSSVLALAALGPVTLDDFTFRALFRCGHRLPPHTMFQEIRSVPEGCLLELDEVGFTTRRFWSPNFQRMHPNRLRDCAESIGRRMGEYCAALADPSRPVFSDLTGGYDSRVSTAALVNRAIPFVATVAGSDRHPDVIAARQICNAQSMPLIVVDPAPLSEGVSTDVRDALTMSEGAVDAFTFATTLRMKRSLAAIVGQPISTVSGALGECYRDFYWSQEFLHRGRRQHASISRLIRYRMDSSPARMDLFSSDWRNLWREELRSYIEEIIEPYSLHRNTAQIDAVYLRKMAGMIGAFATASAQISVPLVPFGSLPALDMALSVPPRWRFQARLLREVSWFLSPGLASHMTLSGRPCAPLRFNNWHKFLPKYRMDLERFVRKFSTVWLGKTFFSEYCDPLPRENPYSPFIRVQSQLGGALHLESMHTGPMYNPRVLTKLLQEATEPQGFSLGGVVSRIYTCEAMVRAARLHVELPAACVGGGRCA